MKRPDPPTSPTHLSDNFEQGDAYEVYIGRWSRSVAPRFLSWLDVPAQRRWLDVGCGTGSLSAAILSHASPRSVVGVEPSEGFLAKARQVLADRAVIHRGSAERIPLGDACVDVTVSGLVLNFCPDGRSALEEMARVTTDGGTIGAYVWDYAGGMELIRRFWDAAVALDPQAAALDEAARFPVCHPEALTALFTAAGLRDVAVTAIDVPTPFATFEDFWRPFLGGQGPAPAYAMALDEDARLRLRELIAARLPVQADGSIALMARAWAVRATVAASTSITSERPDTPDARALIEELDAVLEPLYPRESRHGYSVQKLLDEAVTFFVVRSRGIPAGCGGVKLVGREYAEVKRMYVRPRFRGSGLAERILDQLTEHARSHGVGLLRLETGIHQHAAIKFYERAGFRRIPPFGPYWDDPVSRCYEKRIG